jgi:hypothetical protein
MSKSKSKNEHTLVTFLLDRSGSMEAIKNDTIGAFNAYLDGLAGDKAIKIDFTLIQFDSMSLDKVCVAVPVAQAVKLDNGNYQPRGGTPLIDAAYKTIKAVEGSLNGSDKGTKVVVCIQTDGEENSSTEYTWDQLNALIKEKTALGWQFNFMGASIDAYKQAGRMGISQGSTVSYNSFDPAATRATFRGRASATSLYASGVRADMSFSAADKRASGDVFDPDLNLKPTLTPAKKPVASSVKPKTVSVVDDFKL